MAAGVYDEDMNAERAGIGRPEGAAKLLGPALAAQLLIIAGLAALAAWQLDLHQVASTFIHLRAEWLAAAFLIYVFSRVLHTFEWRVLLVRVGRTPFWGQYGVLLIGSLVNAVLPANLGEVVKLQIM